MSRPTRADAAGRAYLDLLNRARREGRLTQELLVAYVLERFLARLGASAHAGTFVLKGGMLLAALHARRPTVDADLLATQLANDTDTVLARVVEIAILTPETDDGVRYLTETARARTIREDNLYAGVRVTMDARVATAAVKLQLDVNFGDPVTPEPREIDYPVLRPGYPPVQVRGYPLATVLAEKLSTAIDLGTANSRVRDYADVWTLTGVHDLDAAELRAALEATTSYRGVQLRPLSEAITGLAAVRARTYTAYRRRLGTDAHHLPEDFAAVVADVVAFADPVLSEPPITVARWDAATRTWHPHR
ncbi:MAG: nucleotidyl transferase AbiEii/AbiGii toxin family protein [Actinomycetales bacterium]|nr:nucleotidyl transferase AbiEii/AbiGii toxin family protein [Actinomycetales bacterium]